jgi:hypothetical protein
MAFRFALLLFAFSVYGTAGEPSRPACTAENRGDFWPDSANTDRSARAHWYRCGQLHICSAGTWKFEWKQVSVHISRLAGPSSAKALGCELPEPIAATMLSVDPLLRLRENSMPGDSVQAPDPDAPDISEQRNAGDASAPVPD